MEDPEEIPKLHGALKALYGSQCFRNLKHLLSLLKKRATTTTGSEFLLRCHYFHVYPAFIRRSVKFSFLGRHLERLAARLPRWMLRAAIRDMRTRLATIQRDLDCVWENFARILNHKLWNALVAHKDQFYYCQYVACTKCL